MFTVGCWLITKLWTKSLFEHVKAALSVIALSYSQQYVYLSYRWFVDFLHKKILLRSRVEFSRVVGMVFQFLVCRNDMLFASCFSDKKNTRSSKNSLGLLFFRAKQMFPITHFTFLGLFWLNGSYAANTLSSMFFVFCAYNLV